jgi:hypothetical protein
MEIAATLTTLRRGKPIDLFAQERRWQKGAEWFIHLLAHLNITPLKMNTADLVAGNATSPAKEHITANTLVYAPFILGDIIIKLLDSHKVTPFAWLGGEFDFAMYSIDNEREFEGFFRDLSERKNVDKRIRNSGRQLGGWWGGSRLRRFRVRRRSLRGNIHFALYRLRKDVSLMKEWSEGRIAQYEIKRQIESGKVAADDLRASLK